VWALSGEELSAVTVEAGGVRGVLRDVREGFVAFANLLPVRRGELVARVARPPLVPGDAVGKV